MNDQSNAAQTPLTDGLNPRGSAPTQGLVTNEPHCVFIPESKYVMAGWGCGGCRQYNGVWRTSCKGCQHERCITVAQDVIDRQQGIRQQLGYTDDGG